MTEKSIPEEVHPKLTRGVPARLFPVLADTNKESRMVSIFLAILPIIPELSARLLNTVGHRLGKRSSVTTYTEITFKGEKTAEKKHDNRPDGFIAVKSSSKIWEALVEAKIGNNNLEQNQVERYLELAKANDVSALITISNQFVTSADHSPLPIKKQLTRKVDLFHWSWMYIRTECENLRDQNVLDSAEQLYVLNQFIELLDDKGTGIGRYTQMPPDWEDVVAMATNKQAIAKSSEKANKVVQGWFQELRDATLMLSRNVGQEVSQRVERAHMADANKRIKDAIAQLCDQSTLSGKFRVPDAAADIELEVDLAGKAVTVLMQLKAPTDKASTSARVNWLLRMLKKDDERMFVRANWPGRRVPSERSVAELRDNSKAFDEPGNSTVPHSFDVILRTNSSRRFGNKVIIEVIENLLTDYYSLIGQYLRAWQPPPPKPKARKEESKEGDGLQDSEVDSAEE
ncbi:MAG: hypothetical protein JXQ97_11990 [Natronospirillum sp.]